MSDETITLPLDLVMAWRALGDSNGPVDAVRDLCRAIDAAVWKPEQGVPYWSDQHPMPHPLGWVLFWGEGEGGYWSGEGGYWSSWHSDWPLDHGPKWWMLQPPPPPEPF